MVEVSDKDEDEVKDSDENEVEDSNEDSDEDEVEHRMEDFPLWSGGFRLLRLKLPPPHIFRLRHSLAFLIFSSPLHWIVSSVDNAISPIKMSFLIRQTHTCQDVLLALPM